ncbi:MAG: hypothetical protein ACN4GW_08935 [Desulforhopalus sp.]
MSSKKIDIKGDLNTAGDNIWPKKTHPKAYKSFQHMLSEGGLSIDELEENILFCEELAESFLLGDDEHLQIMQDKMKDMTSDQLFFIKATFKQFGRGGTRFGPSYTGISAVAELCRSVELPGLNVSLTDKLGFRYRASDEDLELLRDIYTQRQQTVKEIYDEYELNSSETTPSFVYGFRREIPKGFYERVGGMKDRWRYEN